MRISIRVKLFFILTSIILLFVIITQFFGIFFLEDFYISSKKTTLKESLGQVQKILSKKNDYEEHLTALQNNKNINIIITDKEYNVIFMTALLNRKDKNQLPDPKLPDKRDKHIKDFRENFTNLPKIVTRTDPRMNTEFLSLFSRIKLPDGANGYIEISSSIDAMKDSVKAASDFILYLSLLVTLIGTITIFYVSTKISKPIVKIARLTADMAKLDFSQRIDFNSNDEIGDLGKNINLLSVKLDKTLNELATANIQLKEDIKTKERIDQSRKELIANVSHELKTPISLIAGYAEGLKVNVNTEDKDFYCDVIIDEAEQMNRLVLSLLDLSQVEGGYKQMKKENINASGLVENTLEKFKLIFKEKGIKLSVTYEGDCTVFADPDRIEQVLTNYLTNAMNHVDNRKRIIIRAEEQAEKVVVSVFNTGRPIPTDELSKIWDSFYKIDKARTREYGGSGLGLTIVKAIIEAHGGKYGTTNHEDMVEFWFTLNKE
ncbi:sensor histidine kinase [Bacillus sp. 1NLA3E]|uniref:sensor histidine kinase n=1 Tax=Bacillus sp. 1NLA3E TaxID=666686 RepID=UPI000247E4A8|nr:HAMP domain-containing sensor histidine kinase [Bacillus sp. 1NLA3E]AGK53224.1 integral membrane sensor signal transduction histidine kinase [Bacillus sp. 1NLA3E]